VSATLRQQPAELTQPWYIALPERRQLIQNWAQVSPQPQHPLEEPMQRIGRISQALQMRQESVRLYRVQEPARRLLPPAVERVRLRQAIKRVVDLYRIEDLAVILKPAALRQLARVEPTAPVWVVPTGCADANGRGHDLNYRSVGSFGQLQAVPPSRHPAGRRMSAAESIDGLTRRKERGMSNIHCRVVAAISGFAAGVVCLAPWPAGLALGAAVAQTPAQKQAELDLTPDERINIEVYEKANRSVVNITTKVRSEEFFFAELQHEGSGSGCVLDRDGHVITNNHVIEDAVQNSGNITVMLFDSSPYEAEVVGTDPPNDLAVLRIRAPKEKLFPVTLGDSSDLKVGLRVFVIGNPFGFDRTLTTGIISSLNRTLPVDRVRTIKGIIQTDAAINPGNSGGPLLDKHARVIGLNTAIVSPAGQSSGVGFAIPVNNIKRVVPQLIQYGKVIRADIGILAVYEDRGLLIARLARGGAAAEAGLRGPRVDVRRRGFVEYRSSDPTKADRIVAIDGQKVKKFDELLSYVESKKPGDTVTVTIVREGQLEEVAVKLKTSE
jgi:S1-C subfamily serine protease